MHESQNLGMTCNVNASLQVIASIPEAVTCIMNFSFEAGIHILSSTIGALLQQLVPVIASYTAGSSTKIEATLEEIL